MIKHDYIGEPRNKQKLKHHCLVGYDPASERAVFTLKIPKSKIDLLKHFVRFEPDDPDGYDCYKVEYSNAVRLLDLLGQESQLPKNLEYFVEPWMPH
jgi:hypothetical protein